MVLTYGFVPSDMVILHAEDVTDRMQMRAQLAQADRLSSMGMLAAGVAHEINNPLSYVLYNLESVADDLPDLLEAIRAFQAKVSERAESRGLLGDLSTSAERMNPAMLEDILARFTDALKGTRRIRDIARGLGTFSKVEQDQLVPVNLMHVIEVAINMAYNEIKYRARLVKEYGRIPTVLASEGRLSQVFLNLIINACHAIDEGNVEANEIRVRTWADGDAVCAEVRDSGEGIPEENVGRLFEPFFTTKKIGVGSGLGLAISKNIIEAYGGAIDVQSEVDHGTSFTVRLPIHAEVPEAATPVVGAGPDEASRGRVLIIDDEEGIRVAVARMLRDHETVRAASGTEAMRLLDSDQSFDLILCDMMMPDVSGMEIHQWLAAAHPFLARQFIFMTGGAFTPRAREYLGKVDNIRLEKPFEAANVKKIVSELVRSGKASKRS
jgi:signal transduction histidine kinase/CheY-like chemotaxis protein